MITTKDKLLIGGGILLIVAIVLVGLFLTPKPSTDTDDKDQNMVTRPKLYSGRVESVEPLQDQKGISVVPQVVVNFSSSVVGKKVELKTDPVANFSLQLDKNGEKATFSPKNNLKPKTKYSLQILVSGQPIFSWNAKTKSKGTSQKNLTSVVNKIREQMPVKGSGFRISYDAAGDHFFVFVEKAPYATYKERANSWFRKKGLKDFGALNINYVAKGSALP